jgi:hypothetical protein
MEGARPLRFFLAILAVATFAACGGGGGGATVPGGSSGGSTGGSTTTSSAVRQQSAANSALSVASNSIDVDSYGSASGAVSFAIGRALAVHTQQSTPAPTGTTTCQDGVEFSQSSSSGGTFQETIEFFYDQQCTQPRRLITLDITFASGGGTATGTEELWDSSGNVVDYKTDNATFTTANNELTQITIQRSVAAAPSTQPFAENGFSCVFTQGTPVDCGQATVATINNPQLDPHIYASMTPASGTSPMPSASASPTTSPTPFEIGFAGTVVVTQSTPAASPSASPSGGWGWNPQPISLQLTVAGNGYTGATQSMSIASPVPAATPPAWTITGGTAVVTLSGTATLGFGPSGMFTDANIQLVDSADGLTITFTSASRGGLNGTVTNASNQTVATVTVDANGDGVIDYTTGATAQIRDWIILSS